jgi:hypothetical protein
MGNLSEIQRVVYKHEWECRADWPRALDELAELSDDEIDSLVRSNQQIETV